jgi:hypothetical protein
MAKDGNTYAKRQRETLKRQKAQDKRARRQKRKDQAGNPVPLVREDQPAEESLS